MTQAKKTPAVLWAQRTDKVFLTLEIQDAQKGTLNATENSLKYRCQSASEEGDFEVDLEFYAPIEPSAIVEHVSGHRIEFVIPKANKTDNYWPRLLKTQVKQSFIKTDFDKWRDEEEDDDEEEAGNPYGDFASSFDPSSFDPSQFDPSQFGASGNFDGHDDDDDDDVDEFDDANEKEKDLKHGKGSKHVHDGNCCH